MKTKPSILKFLVDFILYDRLGENPTREEIAKLLDEYKSKQEEIEKSLEQNKLLVCRLSEALDGGALYAEWYKKYREKISEILKQSDMECQGEES